MDTSSTEVLIQRNIKQQSHKIKKDETPKSFYENSNKK